jgi:acyl carrier protein
MTATDFLRKLEQTLELDPGTIAADDVLSEVGWWESMAAILFIALADQELDVSVTGADVKTCRTVADLLRLLGDNIMDDVAVAP